jgi:phage terminase large subunit-like protein
MGNLEKLTRLMEMLADHGLLIESEEKPDGTRDWFPTDIPVTINIEAISYQQSLQADAKAILHDKLGLHNLVLKGVTGYRGDKLSRLRGTFGLFQTGRVLWNRWISWESYWSEFLNYGSTDHDDCPDSFLLSVKGLVGQGRLQPAWGEWEQP